MRTIDEIRHARLLQLLHTSDFQTLQSLADKIGRSNAQVSQWKNRSRRSSGGVASIDSASARLIEEKVGAARGWMDHDPLFDVALLNRGAPPLEAGIDLATLRDLANSLHAHIARCETCCELIERQLTRGIRPSEDDSYHMPLSDLLAPLRRDSASHVDSLNHGGRSALSQSSTATHRPHSHRKAQR